MKNIVLIQSHCDTEEKLDYLKKNIEKIKKFDLEILLFSHIPLNQEVIGMVDYFVFDKSNPILWDERRHYFWWVDNGYKLETTIPDYGWTVFNQIKKSYTLRFRFNSPATIQYQKYNYKIRRFSSSPLVCCLYFYSYSIFRLSKEICKLQLL